MENCNLSSVWLSLLTVLSVRPDEIHNNMCTIVFTGVFLAYAYLLYSTMSGSQICSAGTWSLLTPPYSSGSQRSL